MDINESLGIAKQLKNHFRAFERLEEFVKEVATAQVLIRNLGDRKTKLEDEILILQKKHVENETALNKYLSEREKHNRDAIAEMNEKANAVRASLEALEQRVKSRQEELAKILTDAEEGYKTRMEFLTKSQAEAEEKLARIKREIEAFRKKLE